MTIKVDVITPEKLTFSDEVDFIAAPAVDGEVGILPHHAPLLTRLGFGQLRITKGNTVRHLAVSGGFMEVQAGSQVSIFAETAEMAHEIDSERAMQALERAKSAIQNQKNLSDAELAEAEAALARAIVRIKVAQLGKGTETQRPAIN